MKLPGASSDEERLLNSVIDKYTNLRPVLTPAEIIEGAVLDTFLIFTDDKFRHGWSVGLIAAGKGAAPEVKP